MSDKDEQPVYMTESEWHLKKAEETYPEIEFHFSSEFKTNNDKNN